MFSALPSLFGVRPTIVECMQKAEIAPQLGNDTGERGSGGKNDITRTVNFFTGDYCIPGIVQRW